MNSSADGSASVRTYSLQTGVCTFAEEELSSLGELVEDGHKDKLLPPGQLKAIMRGNDRGGREKKKLFKIEQILSHSGLWVSDGQEIQTYSQSVSLKALGKLLSYILIDII